VNSTPRSTWLSLVSTRETGAAKKTAPIFPGMSSRLRGCLAGGGVID